jgi:hypothetical protein
MAITFATSVSDPAQTNCQIKFMAMDIRPARHLIFDWATSKLASEAPEDIYSKFILSQLRLDTSLVIEHTSKLSRTAVWRATRHDDMANALAWASKRASLDGAVESGQPADLNLVAAVLREDPTLTDDLRVAYCRHLLAFSLALNDATQTDIVPTIASQNGEVADAVYAQLETAARSEQAMAVYHLVARWIAQPPLGVDTNRWLPLLGVAALAEANGLIPADPSKVVSFLEQFIDAPTALQLDAVVAQMIGVLRRRAYDNPDIAKAIFLLAVTYLPVAGLQRLFADPSLAGQLPAPVRAVFPHMVPIDAKTALLAPPGLLVKASEVFNPERRPLVIVRLVEWAMTIQRYDMLDSDALRELVRVGASPVGERFDGLIKSLVHDLSQFNILRTLDSKAPQYLAQLSLVRGRHSEAMLLLEMCQDMLYKAARQDDMITTIRAVFRDAPLSPKALLTALDALRESQLRPVVHAHAYVGALEARNWGADMEPAARRLTAIVFGDPRQTALIGLDSVLRLLKANADRRDAVEALRLAGALAEYAMLLDARGIELMSRIYSLVTWGPEVTDAAQEILRAYIRRAPLEFASAMPQRIGERHGAAVHRMLDASLRLRLVVGGDFAAFAEEVHLGTELLIDMAMTYHDGHDIPQIPRLRRLVEGVAGALNDSERTKLAGNLNRIGELILKLHRLHEESSRRRNRHENEIRKTQQIMQRSVAPATGVEALRWLGAHFSGGQPVTLSLERETAVHLLGNRSVNMLAREVDLLVSLFDGLLAAFPEKETPPIDLEAWTSEVQSLWSVLSAHKQGQSQPLLARDTQRLSQVIVAIGEKGNERSLQPGGYGRQLQIGRAQPRSVIDALRWLSGFFANEHV